MEIRALSSRHKIQDLLRDIDAGFLRDAGVATAWEYSHAYDELEQDALLSEDQKKEEFNRRRGMCVTKGLRFAAEKNGIPFEYFKCSNGQSKLIVKCGRVLLIQEPISALSDGPKIADYKVELAEAHGIVRQLELDLGDRPSRVIDPDGCALGVVLHGARGALFEREEKELGAFMLAFPDATYTHWVVRLDILDVAMEGLPVDLGADVDDTASRDTEQPDKVIVTLKKRARKEVS